MGEQARKQTETPPKPEGLLYHYTSLEGFLGIIDSDSLRATHIRYMNDSREFLDGLNYLDSIMKDFPGALKSKMGPFFDSIVSHVSGKSGAYVISFTDDEAATPAPHKAPGDRLSQWRAYSGGLRGLSMGLDYDSLHGDEPGKCWSTGGSLVYLLNCLYDAEEKRRVFSGVGELAAPKFESILADTVSRLQVKTSDGFSGLAEHDIKPANEDSRISYARWFLMTGMVINATTFKDPAYFEEKEWRIVILAPSKKPLADAPNENASLPIKFRSGALGVTPYVEYPLKLGTPDSALRRIVVGPTPHAEGAVEAVKMLLEDKGIRLRSGDFPDGVEVVPSKIPYRNW
jgi:hypothetical protein